MSNSTATGTPVGRLNSTDLEQPRPIGEILRELFAARDRAYELLRAVDPVAVELYQAGFRAGIEEGERRADDQGERDAGAFLNYLAEDADATPGPIPPFELPHRHLGVAA